MRNALGQGAGGHVWGAAPAWRECLGLESTFHGLKDKGEEVGNETAPPETTWVAWACNWINETSFAFCRKVLTSSSLWALMNTSMFLLVPAEHLNRHWLHHAMADGDSPVWVGVCSSLFFCFLSIYFGPETWKSPIIWCSAEAELEAFTWVLL